MALNFLGPFDMKNRDYNRDPNNVSEQDLY